MKAKTIGFGLAGIMAVALAGTTMTALASSHREAPGVTKTPKIDNTDVYMFRSYEPGRQDYVTIIANFQPAEAPVAGPSYYTMDPDAVYEIHIDNDGDAVEDLTFQFKFTNALAASGAGAALTIGGKSVPVALRAIGQVTDSPDADLNESESYTATLIAGDRRSGTKGVIKTSGSAALTSFVKPLDNIGNKTLPDYDAYANKFIYTVSIPGCSTPGRMFVGQREEAFAVNLGHIFDLVNLVPIEGDSAPYAGDGAGFPGGITQNRAHDDLVGKLNVASIAIEVPIACVVGTGNGTIGAWSTSSLPQAALGDPTPAYEKTQQYGGAYVQRSRLGMPLVNELVIGLAKKDLFNASEPKDDAGFADFVTNPTFPEILNILFKQAVNTTLGTNIADLAPSNFPRNDLVAAFLTGIEGLNQMKTVTPSEMIRLNTAIPPTPRDSQQTYGVVAQDLAGFPNGRRPGDDTVDIVLRVAMGRLCYPVIINGTSTDLGYCTPEQAPVGNVAFTDGAPISARELQNKFPYLNTPLPGSRAGTQ